MGDKIPITITIAAVKLDNRNVCLSLQAETSITVHNTHSINVDNEYPKKVEKIKLVVAPIKEPMIRSHAAEKDSSINTCSTIMPEIMHHNPEISGELK